MNRIIGFDRRLRFDWLDDAVGLCRDGIEPGVIAAQLNDRLEREIAGSEARRKTVTVLLRIWVNVPGECKRLRGEALDLAAQIQPAERLWLHWGMALLAYPFFRDVAGTVGHLGRLQGALGHAQVQRRMTEAWGQRTTLERAVQRVLRTLVDLDVLTETGRRGQYSIAPVRRTQDQDLALWALECALRVHEAEQVPIEELGHLAYMFPFDVSSHLNEVRCSGRFESVRQGLDLEMVAVNGWLTW